ncbi:MAG: hypothetical protein K1X81_03340 [Bacteroidia bacterium]|nr:hypothetical protein [Bacteroidia bacterium]
MWEFNWFSSIGIILDIIGALLLFRYGLPSEYIETPPENMGVLGANPIWEEDEYKKMEADIEKRNKKIIFWSRVGLGCLIIGFVLQFIGTNLK